VFSRLSLQGAGYPASKKPKTSKKGLKMAKNAEKWPQNGPKPPKIEKSCVAAAYLDERCPLAFSQDLMCEIALA